MITIKNSQNFSRFGVIRSALYPILDVDSIVVGLTPANKGFTVNVNKIKSEKTLFFARVLNRTNASQQATFGGF
jgi:hypothetical protein